MAINRQMRIVSWNIRAGGGRRSELIAEQIERWAADVVVLQEYRATAPSVRLGEALAAQGLVHQLTTTDASLAASNRLLLASRWPLRAVWPRSAPAEPGRWLLAAVDAPVPFSIGGMHAPNRVSGRKYPFLDAVLRLARGWRRGPALLAGDTNSGRIGLDEEVPAFNKIEDGWMQSMEAAGWRDAFRQLHGEERAYTWYSPNGRNGFRLDEAFVNGALLPRLREARHEWGTCAKDRRREALSDHAALLLEFD